VLETSPRTAKRDWALARLWPFKQMNRGPIETL
jgi:hypothetical protein